MIGQQPHLAAVGGDAGGRGDSTRLFTVVVLPPSYPDTGHQPAQIPFPTSWMRLVEVVQVDHQVAFGRGVEPEIAEMRIPTDHRGNAGRG